MDDKPSDQNMDTPENKTETSNQEISNENVDLVLGAGAQALQASTAMFGDPLKTTDNENNSEEQTSTDPDNHVDDVLGAGAEALHSSAAMFGDPLKPSQTEEAHFQEKQFQKVSDGGDDVDVVLGAGAHALHASAMMFGDPLKSPESAEAKIESEVDRIDDGEGVICEEEMDVTQHDDLFDIDVRIRLVEANDENTIRGLIYDGIYVAALNRYLLNASERPYIVCVIGLFAVLFSWLFGGIVIALFLSVVMIPLSIYLYVRYIALVFHRRRNLPDVQTGIYKYWTATNEGRVMWVAEVEGKVVGTVAVETHSAVVAELKHLSVAPEWQCLGIGGRLAQHAISHIRRRRFKKIIAHILSIHNEAVNMYTKLGFRRTNVRTVMGGFCTLEDFDMNLSTGSRADLIEGEE